MRSLIHSTIQDVTIKENLGHKVIQAALDRIVAGHVDWDNFKSLDTLLISKQHECRSDADKLKLALLYKHSDKLKKARSYALKLTNIFNTGKIQNLHRQLL